MEYNPPNLQGIYSLEKGFAQATGAVRRPAKGLEGRVYSIPDDQIGMVRLDTLRKMEKDWGEMSRTGKGIPHDQVADMRQKLPDFKGKSHNQIAQEIGREYGHLSDMIEAKQKGGYVEFEKDGRVQRGIVRKGVDGQERREGLWLEKDSHNRVRKSGEFLDGVPHGEFRDYREDGTMERTTRYQNGRKDGAEENYNGRGELVRRAEFEHDRLVSEKAINPEQERVRETLSKQMARSVQVFRR